MFDSRAVLIDRFADRLLGDYGRMYSNMDASIPGMLRWAATMTMEVIATSDAPYHDIEHSMMVTLVGQEILRGKHILEGGVAPRDWLNVLVSLLCHDIGYVRGICPGDTPGSYKTGHGEDTFAPGPDATDACSTPYHVERGKRFVLSRFAGHPVLDEHAIAANIEYTRFPLPDGAPPPDPGSFPAIVGAADLIGQMGDPAYLRKLPALFFEFQETGAHVAMGYETADDLRQAYPSFFWQRVSDHIAPAIRYLQATGQGRKWIANLYSNIFAIENGARL